MYETALILMILQKYDRVETDTSALLSIQEQGSSRIILLPALNFFLKWLLNGISIN